MENCIVTKLLGTVDNNSLPKLETMLYHVDGTQSSDSVLSISMIGASNAKIINNTDSVHFTNEGGTENYGTELTSIPQNGTVYITRGTCDIEVFSKYNLSTLSNNSSVKPDFNTMYYFGCNAAYVELHLNERIDTDFAWFYGNEKILLRTHYNACGFEPLIERLEDLNRLSDLIYVDFTNVNLSTFGLDYFLKFPNLETLQLNQCNISGNFANLGVLTSLITLLLTNSAITGSIEEFVLNNRDNGRLTASRVNTWYFSLTNITWRGVRNNLANLSFISWTETTITVNPQGGAADTRTYYKDSGGNIITD